MKLDKLNLDGKKDSIEVLEKIFSAKINKRLKLHNCGKGAKYTKGRSWKIIYSKKFTNKFKMIKI